MQCEINQWMRKYDEVRHVTRVGGILIVIVIIKDVSTAIDIVYCAAVV